MKIFVSWSGDLSNRIALILKNWIPRILSSVEVFVSSEDISKGSRWNEKIASELSSSDFGILCLTKDNHEAPWLIFEAGALSNSVGTSKVCPFLFGVEVDEIAKPLQQFQATTFTSQDVFKLFRDINDLCENNKFNKETLEILFNNYWQNFSDQIEVINPYSFTSLKSNEVEIKDIRERLNTFYHPAQSAFMIANKFLENPQDLDLWRQINSRKTGNEVQETSDFERACIYVDKGLEKIANYRSLAKGDTLKAFNKYFYEEKSKENYSELSRLINRDIEDYENILNK